MKFIRGEKMKKIAVIGAQWGDEGKGKIVNYFSKNYDWVARFSGGSNAGHTIFFKDKKYVNHLLPSISLETQSKGYLGSGMVIDLVQMGKELSTLEKDFKGISARFYLDLQASLVLPWNKQEDEFFESQRSKPVGTTKRGIGPAYTDKTSREGLRVYDLLDTNRLKIRLSELYSMKKKLYGQAITSSDMQVYDELMEGFNYLTSLKVNLMSSIELYRMLDKQSILFEGAQGVMLDIDCGTYPFVTSSTCTAHGINSFGLSVTELDDVYAVVKAYTTRVGEGPFPTEDCSDKGNILREKGLEFGATTGRPRRTGWLDLPSLRYAILKSKITKLVLTKADVLNGFDEVKICTHYEIDNKKQDMPYSTKDFSTAKPVYVNLKGWQTMKDKTFEEYLIFIEKNLGVKVEFVSYGPKTDEIFKR